jgi:hypothetical protein
MASIPLAEALPPRTSCPLEMMFDLLKSKVLDGGDLGRDPQVDATGDHRFIYLSDKPKRRHSPLHDPIIRGFRATNLNK